MPRQSSWFTITNRMRQVVISINGQNRMRSWMCPYLGFGWQVIYGLFTIVITDHNQCFLNPLIDLETSESHFTLHRITKNKTDHVTVTQIACLMFLIINMYLWISYIWIFYFWILIKNTRPRSTCTLNCIPWPRLFECDVVFSWSWFLDYRPQLQQISNHFCSWPLVFGENSKGTLDTHNHGHGG